MNEQPAETNPPKVAEAAVEYGSVVASLQKPLILERDGQPLAVLISFEEYRRLQALDSEERQRQQKAWLDLEKLLAKIHSRPSNYTPEQIEAEITVARAEARELRYGRRSRN